MVSPDSLGTACPLSGRNSTYRLVQISGTSSEGPAAAGICRPLIGRGHARQQTIRGPLKVIDCHSLGLCVACQPCQREILIFVDKESFALNNPVSLSVLVKIP